MSFKNLKIVKKLSGIPAQTKWLAYSQGLKMKPRSIDFLIPEMMPIQEELSLEQTVRNALVQEFSYKIKDMHSFELLVDATVKNLETK